MWDEICYNNNSSCTPTKKLTPKVKGISKELRRSSLWPPSPTLSLSPNYLIPPQRARVVLIILHLHCFFDISIGFGFNPGAEKSRRKAKIVWENFTGLLEFVGVLHCLVMFIFNKLFLTSSRVGNKGVGGESGRKEHVFFSLLVEDGKT